MKKEKRKGRKGGKRRRTEVKEAPSMIRAPTIRRRPANGDNEVVVGERGEGNRQGEGTTCMREKEARWWWQKRKSPATGRTKREGTGGRVRGGKEVSGRSGRARETKRYARENGHCHHLTSQVGDRTLESSSARKLPTLARTTVPGCLAV